MSDIVSLNRWLYLRWERDFHRTVHVSDGRTRQWWSDMVALQSCAEDEEEEEEEGKEKTFEVYTWGRIPLFMQTAQKDTDVTSPCRRDYARMARLWNPISLLSRVIKVLALATYLTELETNTCRTWVRFAWGQANTSSRLLRVTESIIIIIIYHWTDISLFMVKHVVEQEW